MTDCQSMSPDSPANTLCARKNKIATLAKPPARNSSFVLPPRSISTLATHQSGDIRSVIHFFTLSPLARWPHLATILPSRHPRPSSECRLPEVVEPGRHSTVHCSFIVMYLRRRRSTLSTTTGNYFFALFTEQCHQPRAEAQ